MKVDERAENFFTEHIPYGGLSQGSKLLSNLLDVFELRRGIRSTATRITCIAREVGCVLAGKQETDIIWSAIRPDWVRVEFGWFLRRLFNSVQMSFVELLAHRVVWTLEEIE